jgi:hypothetical protein
MIGSALSESHGRATSLVWLLAAHFNMVFCYRSLDLKLAQRAPKVQIRIETTCDPYTIGSVGERHTVRPTQLRIGRPGKEHHGPNSQASAIRFNVLVLCRKQT